MIDGRLLGDLRLGRQPSWSATLSTTGRRCKGVSMLTTDTADETIQAGEGLVKKMGMKQ